VSHLCVNTLPASWHERELFLKEVTFFTRNILTRLNVTLSVLRFAFLPVCIVKEQSNNAVVIGEYASYMLLAS